MKITAVCCTFLRPKKLGHLIRCFEKQDYADRELVILDDAGQYENQAGDCWRLVSVDKRYPTLGEKRNAAVKLASADAEAFAVWVTTMSTCPGRCRRQLPRCKRPTARGLAKYSAREVVES